MRFCDDPPPSTCAVCARPARGYHCGVATCKGCKTFFRRMCVSSRHVDCFANDDCFDLVARYQPMLRCRACRYKKCVAVGMDPLALELDEQESSAPNYRQLVKRTTSSRDDTREVVQTVESVENKLQKMTDMLVYLESKLEAFRASSYNPVWQDIGGIECVLKRTNTIGEADRVGPMSGWPLSQYEPPSISTDFWKELGNRMIRQRTDTKHWLFFDLLTTLEYAKTFMFFNRLDMKDRLTLMRHVTIACMNLHISYFAVSKKFDSRIQPDGTFCPVNIGPLGNAWSLLLGPLIRCQVTFTEYVILKTVCLCNPAVAGLSEHAQNILSHERHLFAGALLDHCRRTRSDGIAHFAQLLALIQVVERQQRLQKDLYLVHISPFLARIPKELKILLIETILEH